MASSLVVTDWQRSGQQKLATELEFFQYRFSDSFGGNPPLYSLKKRSIGLLSQQFPRRLILCLIWYRHNNCRNCLLV
ncbi:Uncharacterised protein [Shigella sonnei]|nr:Uncharacterised protein [Shigella sonnei]